MPNAHARCSPSALHRILNCTPSLVQSEQFEDETSSYAAEGSAGHALAEHLIKKYLKLQTKRPTSDYYTDELLDAVDEYVAFVTGLIEEARRECLNPIFSVEQKVDLSGYIDGCFGTADMVIITDDTVHVIDLKLGRGIEVSAVDNDQLKAYGLGVLTMADMLYDIETVRLTIFQPRLYNQSTWEITPEDLRKWGEEILKPRGAMALIGAGEFHAGSWCRFCKARNQCRARAESFLDLAKYEFRPPVLLTDEEIAEVMTKAEDLSQWVSDVFAYATAAAIEDGTHFENWKLVEGRSVRKFTDSYAVEQAARDAGYTDIYSKSLITLTAFEKLMGKDTFQEVLGPYVTKPRGKLTLVPVTDKRPEVNVNTAQNDFNE